MAPPQPRPRPHHFLCFFLAGASAGITVFVAGILGSDRPQDRNVAYVHLTFLQETVTRGGSGGIVTQFNVNVDDPTQMESIASSIDEAFRYDEFPTSTWPEKAFVGRAVRDIIELVGFASWVGWASLIAVLALVANELLGWHSRAGACRIQSLAAAAVAATAAERGSADPVQPQPYP